MMNLRGLSSKSVPMAQLRAGFVTAITQPAKSLPPRSGSLACGIVASVARLPDSRDLTAYLDATYDL
jgi:hypothetical protein